MLLISEVPEMKPPHSLAMWDSEGPSGDVEGTTCTIKITEFWLYDYQKPNNPLQEAPCMLNGSVHLHLIA